MRNNHRNRVDSLAARRPQLGATPNMGHWPFVLNACEMPDGSFVDEATYKAACQRYGPGLAWPSYPEMLSIWAEAGQRIAEDHARWAAVELPPGTRIGDKVW